LRRAVVTGGAGFIGSHVDEALKRADYQVLVIDDLSTGSRTNVPTGVEFARLDIRDGDALKGRMCGFGPQLVVHLAAAANVAASALDPAADVSTNVLGTVAVMQAAAVAGCEKVVFTSSSTVYGNPARQPVRETDPLRPISPYGVSKLAAEHFVRVLSDMHGMRYTILRFGNVFGPRDSVHSRHVITSFVAALLDGQRPVIEWDGKQSKDYVYVVDVAAAVVAAADRGDNEVFNVATGSEFTVLELLELVRQTLDADIAPVYAARRPGDVRRFLMDVSKAHHGLGWWPRTSFVDGLETTVESMLHDRAMHEAPAGALAG
jgi:UDP-glucose 4-epimerase